MNRTVTAAVPSTMIPDDRRVLLRGVGVTGVTGVTGSLLMLAAFVLVGALGLPDTSGADALLRFPEIRYARLAENLLYLAAVVLWAVQHDLLHRLLRGTAPVLSSAARTVGILGVAALAAGALLNVATAPMAAAYQQVAEADRSDVVLAWTAMQAVLDAMLITGVLLLPVTIVLFGLGLSRGLSPVLGWGAVAVGIAGLAGATIAAATPPSAFAAVSILGALAFHLAVGIRCIRLSRS